MTRIDYRNELRSIQLNILQSFQEFCNHHHLTFYLGYGSMLGAVRHNGFIPWDDDIDVLMFRNDYNRFIELASEFNNSVFRVRSHMLDSSHLYPFIKIEDKRTLVIENLEQNYDIGINIDLFPIDKIPSDPRLQKKMFRKFRLLISILLLKQIKFKRGRSWTKNSLLLLSHIFLKPISIKSLVLKIDKNAKQYQGFNTDFCGVAVWGYGNRDLTPRYIWNDVIITKFENLQVPIPSGYDTYLKSIYGDYMEFPPIEKQVPHHDFEAYWR